MSFAKNIGKYIGKNISKNLSDKYSRKLPDSVKQSAADALKTSWKRVIQKTPESIGDLITNRNANKITKVSSSLHNNSETITNEHGK